MIVCRFKEATHLLRALSLDPYGFRRSQGDSPADALLGMLRARICCFLLLTALTLAFHSLLRVAALKHGVAKRAHVLMDVASCFLACCIQ